MKPAILLLIAAATIGAAPARPSAPPSRYEASGFEPSWELAIERGRLTLNPGTTEPVMRMPVPRRQPVRNGYRLVSPRLAVDVRHTRCEGYDSRTWTDTIHITLHGRTNDGCGGTPIAPASLEETGWYIRSVAGTRLPGDSDDWKIDFRGGRATLRVRCQEYSGTYRERRPTLTLGTWQPAAQGSCVGRPELRALGQRVLEQRALAILRGPLRISFVEGDTLVLTGPGGSIRLFPLA